VGNVDPNSPGSKAGLQRGDVIMELNDQRVSGPNDLRLKIGTMAPGSSVRLKIDRTGESHNVSLTLGEAPAGKNAGNGPSGSVGNSPMRGVQVDKLTPQIRDQLGLNSGVNGVVVTEVTDGSPASDAGLQRGDVIEQVNRESVNSVADYERLVSQGGKQAVVLLVNRGGATTFIAVQPE
jgi:serine protease Do